MKDPKELVEPIDASLLDIVDNVLSKGVVLRGDLMIGVAGVDLIYVQLSALLCASDRLFGPQKKKEEG